MPLISRLPIFTQELFYYQIDNLSEWQEKIQHIIMAEETNLKTEPSERCNVFAGRTDWNSHQRYKALDDLGTEIRLSLEDFIRKEGYDIPTLALHECWVNWYKKDEHAVPHKHDNFLAVVLFLNVEDSESYFFVHADNNAVLQKKETNHVTYNNLKQINVKDGTVIFFDGKVMHSVSANKSNKTRVTVAFNFVPIYDEIRHEHK